MQGQIRSVGYANIQTDAYPKLYNSREGKVLSHVTFITGVNEEHLGVPEVKIENKFHGALSWFFAQAIRGKADGNQNGRLERDELERFLVEKIGTLMNKQQIPKILPFADKVSVFNLAPSFEFEEENSVQYTFVANKGQTEVFNHTGDKVTTLSGTQGKQALIEKQHFLQMLAREFDMQLSPIRIHLKEGDHLHQKGHYLHFSITQAHLTENTGNLNALTLFGLGSQGELQFLYPLSEYNDPLRVTRFPYHLPPMIVGPRLGAEHLVAILCQNPPKNLHRLLARVAPKLPKLDNFLHLLHENRCQVGQYAVFSG